MPRAVALLLYSGLILWLFRRDQKFRFHTSAALWIPFFSLAIIASRPVSAWLGLFGIPGFTTSNLDGNPIEMLYHLLLTWLAFRTLQRRQIDWRELILRNQILCGLFLYWGISTLWSDFPIPSFKRSTREILLVPIVLVILTDTNPGYALKTVFVRCGFLLFPLSILFIRYFPEIGRAFHNFTGFAMNTGVAAQKNGLGELTLTFGFATLWEISDIVREKGWRELKRSALHLVLTLLMGLHLLFISESKTSQICFVLGSAILILSNLPVFRFRPRALIGLLAIVAVLGYIANSAFGISERAVRSMGRDMSFTGRTELWEEIRGSHFNPIIGTGYGVFWDTTDGKRIWDTLRLRSAHSGYMETYANLGIIGVAAISVFLLAVGTSVFARLTPDQPFVNVRFIFWIIAIVHNFSETGFTNSSPIWFCLMLAAIDPPAIPALFQAPALGDRFSNPVPFTIESSRSS